MDFASAETYHRKSARNNLGGAILQLIGRSRGDRMAMRQRRSSFLSEVVSFDII